MLRKTRPNKITHTQSKYSHLSKSLRKHPIPLNIHSHSYILKYVLLSPLSLALLFYSQTSDIENIRSDGRCMNLKGENDASERNSHSFILEMEKRKCHH